MAFKYKNTSNLDQTVPNVGIVKAGGEVTTDVEINNPNFDLVDSGAKKDNNKDKKGK